jgi:hypothetical protein
MASEISTKLEQTPISEFSPINYISVKTHPLLVQNYPSEKDSIVYPQVREFPYIRAKLSTKNLVLGLIFTILSNILIAVMNEKNGAQMPTYLLISSISNISFNIAILAWLFDIELFRIFLVPLFPLYPLLIYVIATQVAPELRLFNYFWHGIHLFYIMQSIVSKKLCKWSYVPYATGSWVLYMFIITLCIPQMRFILLPLNQAIISILCAGFFMTGLLYRLQRLQ